MALPCRIIAAIYPNSISSGDPHPTGDDPFHASGVLGVKSMKRKNRVTSFHAYPDGTVRFSNKQLPVVKVDTSASAEAQRSAASYPATYQPATSAAPEWVWDENTKRYRSWNGSEWVWQ